MTTTQTWTTRTLLAWMGKAFADEGLDSPRLSAEILMAHVLGCERLGLYTAADRPASADELSSLRALTARALKHEPVQYLTEDARFYGMDLKTDRRALIPRPSTETLVDAVIEHLRSEEAPDGSVLDLCTGSGCVALALARALQGRSVVATDVSADALALAAENAVALGLAERVVFRQGSLFAAVEPGERFAAIATNPPYIPDHEWGDVEPNVKDHEPHLALRGGGDGLDLVRPIVQGAAEWLEPGGLLAVEIASCTAEEVRAMLEAQGSFERVRALKDFEGLDRVAVALRRR